MYLTKEAIIQALNCTSNMAAILLRRYKSKWKEEGKKLLDNKTIATYYFIQCYSKEYGIDTKELCKAFGYEYRLLKEREEQQNG